MRYAIVSDIHANRQAWAAVLTDTVAEGADSILCLGDVVGYGPSPSEVLESVHQNCGAIILGNHDAVVGGILKPDIFNENARRVIEWTREQVGPHAAEYFAQMPGEIEGDGFLAAHGEIVEPLRFNYIEEVEEARENFQWGPFPLLFIGHTHRSGIFILDEATGRIQWYNATDFCPRPGLRYIVNVGSVGDPRDPDVRASYCVYDTERRSVHFRKVPFDTLTYRVDLQRSGLTIKPYFLLALASRETEDARADGDWVVSVQRPAPPHVDGVGERTASPSETGPEDSGPPASESVARQAVDRLAGSDVVRRLRARRQAEMEAQREADAAAQSMEDSQRLVQDATRAAAEQEAVRRRQQIARAAAEREADHQRREREQREILRQNLAMRRARTDGEPRPGAGTPAVAAGSEPAAPRSPEPEEARREEESRERRLQRQKELAERMATKQSEANRAKEAQRERIRRILERKRHSAQGSGGDAGSAGAPESADPPAC